MYYYQDLPGMRACAVSSQFFCHRGISLGMVGYGTSHIYSMFSRNKRPIIMTNSCGCLNHPSCYINGTVEGVERTGCRAAVAWGG